ncbi:MAG: hypothetical protein BAA03_14265 [Caldibacillus debilis]|nr:MAG: hypothetical protein BAA03_14265 [Caldibacillus debilis]
MDAVANFLSLVRFYLFLFYIRTAQFFGRLFRRKSPEEKGPFPEESQAFDTIPQDAYQSIFLSGFSQPNIYMPRPVFDQIIRSLPEGYKLPNERILALLKEAEENYWRLQFKNASVDPAVWERMERNLPEGYQLLNSFVFNHPRYSVPLRTVGDPAELLENVEHV